MQVFHLCKNIVSFLEFHFLLFKEKDVIIFGLQKYETHLKGFLYSITFLSNQFVPIKPGSGWTVVLKLFKFFELIWEIFSFHFILFLVLFISTMFPWMWFEVLCKVSICWTWFEFYVEIVCQYIGNRTLY